MLPVVALIALVSSPLLAPPTADVVGLPPSVSQHEWRGSAPGTAVHVNAVGPPASTLQLPYFGDQPLTGNKTGKDLLSHYGWAAGDSFSVRRCVNIAQTYETLYFPDFDPITVLAPYKGSDGQVHPGAISGVIWDGGGPSSSPLNADSKEVDTSTNVKNLVIGGHWFKPNGSIDGAYYEYRITFTSTYTINGKTKKTGATFGGGAFFTTF